MSELYPASQPKLQMLLYILHLWWTLVNGQGGLGQRGQPTTFNIPSRINNHFFINFDPISIFRIAIIILKTLKGRGELGQQDQSIAFKITKIISVAHLPLFFTILVHFHSNIDLFITPFGA